MMDLTQLKKCFADNPPEENVYWISMDAIASALIPLHNEKSIGPVSFLLSTSWLTTSQEPTLQWVKSLLVPPYAVKQSRTAHRGSQSGCLNEYLGCPISEKPKLQNVESNDMRKKTSKS